MKFKNFVNENNKIKAGDWVEGIASSMLNSVMISGIFVTNVTDEFSLIATWQQNNKNKKKIYVQVYNITKTQKDPNAPKDLLSFAKKHDYYNI